MALVPNLSCQGRSEFPLSNALIGVHIISDVSAEKYLDPNSQYLREAQKFLASGNLVQTSEKLWGAVAEMVKAVATKRGIALGTHRSLWDFVYQLNQEHPQLRLTDLFSAAETLHINFYEDHLSQKVVEDRAQRVHQLIERLKTLL